MPVTAKLSRMFYEKMGDEVTNELVDWLNSVDLSYRQEFRELFEAHFGRLGADMRGLEDRVFGRLGLVQSAMSRLEERLGGEMKQREDRLRGDMKQLEERMDGQMTLLRGEMKHSEERVSGQMKHLGGEMKQLEERLGVEMTQLEERLRAEMKQLEERLRGEIKAQKSELIGWMLLFWVATVAATRLLG